MTLVKVNPQKVVENKYVQLMILLSSGEIDSCKWNAREMHKRLDDDYFKYTVGTKNEKTGFNKWGRDDTYQYVNIALLYVKCLLVESKDHQEVGQVLDKA